jgi:hypothetical protein
MKTKPISLLRTLAFATIALATMLVVSLQLQNAWAASKAASGQNCTIVGTAKSETLMGTAKNDVICGLGGNDTLIGGGGNDILDGGTGNDRLLGQAGNDTMIGGTGADSYDGGTGTNRCVWLTGDKPKVSCTVLKLSAIAASPSPSASAGPSSPAASASPSPSSSSPSGGSNPVTPSIGLVVNFENSQTGTSSVDFGGEASSITSEGLPAGGSANNYTALKTVKGSIAWSGVSFFAKPGTSLITSTHKTISANVWASAAGSAEARCFGRGSR